MGESGLVNGLVDVGVKGEDVEKYLSVFILRIILITLEIDGPFVIFK